MAKQFAKVSEVSRVGVVVIAVFCAVALSGWVLGLSVLTSVFPGWARMSVPTILSFLLCGLCVLALADRRRYADGLRLSAAFVVLIIAFCALAGFVLSGGLRGAAQASASGYLFGPHLGRVAPATAFNFILASVALLLPRTRQAGVLYGLLLAVGLAVTGLDLVGYAYGVDALYKLSPFSAMALPTALSFALLFVSALLARPDDGWIVWLVADDSGGIAARRMFPAVVVLPFGLAGSAVLAFRWNVFDAPFGFAVLAVATIIGLAIITCVVAAWLAHRDLERQRSRARLQGQLERLNLLEQTTRAIAQHQDLRSIFQVVTRSLEDRLPADFVCICRYDRTAPRLSVEVVGSKSVPLGETLNICEKGEIEIDENGLSRCVGGQLVYEPDTALIDFPFPHRLARQGLRSLVVTPLMADKDVFGVLAVSRLAANAFLSTDCEFLKQLGEHVALAARQAQLREKLQNAYDDLRQTQQSAMQEERLSALGQMASGIGHDINNAISPVAVYTKSLLEREPDLSPQVRNYLAIVDRVVKDISATVGRMRDFYRPITADSDLEPLNLNSLVAHVIELTKARWSDMPQQRGVVVKFETDLQADLPLVMGNAGELREAAINLVFNAVDAMPEGGTIAVRTISPVSGVEGRSVELEVSDTGTGMDDEIRRRCLEPFFTTKGERGTGLGLAMVYGAAQRHKARLDIDSMIGKGTSVRLVFAATEQSAVNGVTEIDLDSLRPLRLLLVDDDPAVLESTRDVLMLDGHSVVAADGGEAGIKMLRAAKAADEEFDAVITDLGMPYIDGNQVAQLAKELFPSMPVILLTGWGRRMAGDGSGSSNVDFGLSKPLDLDELRMLFIRHVQSW